MSASETSQSTDFSRDVLGRFICNGLDEALASTQRIDARSTSSLSAAAASARSWRSACSRATRAMRGSAYRAIKRVNTGQKQLQELALPFFEAALMDPIPTIR